RLYLRNLAVKDAEFVFRLLNSPGWLEHIGDRGIQTLEDAIRYIKHNPSRSYRRSKYGLKAVLLKETDEPIGICGLIQRDYLTHPDLGFAFLPEYAGKGYGYESSAAVLSEPKIRWPVYAMTGPDNHASQGLLKKLGFVSEGTFLMPSDQFESLMFKLYNFTK
ncbi:MAG: GNAT family N-acetyltransferase, partial [Cyclobacteriaceae bacterium]